MVKKINEEELNILKERVKFVPRKTNFIDGYAKMKHELLQEIKDGKEILFKGQGQGKGILL